MIDEDDFYFWLSIYIGSYIFNIGSYIARYIMDLIACDKKINAHQTFYSKTRGINGLSSSELNYFLMIFYSLIPTCQFVICIFDYLRFIYEVKKQEIKS